MLNSELILFSLNKPQENRRRMVVSGCAATTGLHRILQDKGFKLPFVYEVFTVEKW